MSEPLLEVSKVAKHFGGLYALNGLDLHVNEHEIVSVIGPNGAGKSTLFNVITGLYTPDDGDVVFRGESILRRAQPGPEARDRLHVPERAAVPEHDGARERDGGQHCRTKAGVLRRC